MAKLRKGCSYRRIKRPYTRKSKFRKLSYVRAIPANKVVRFETGNAKKEFPTTLHLVSKDSLQIRHNAIESARVSATRHLEKTLGKLGFYLRIRTFPHHVLRENPLASGAGADRMSTGMQKSFGKTIGIAAQVKRGQILIDAGVEENQIEVARIALKRASYKLPCSCSIVIK
jgi:large subunit ribosomal protein L10e